MAKKKGGGSNLGLIITLVFFVLTTVILGVTTYMGYNEIDKHEAAKKEADKAKGVAENNAKYLRMQNRVLFSAMGYPPAGVEKAEIARDKKAFEEGSFAAAAQEKDKDEVLKVFRTLDKAMPWDGTAPTVTYEDRITKLGAEVEQWKAKTRNAEKMAKDTETAKKDLEEAKDKRIAALEKSYDDFSKKFDAELRKGLADIGAKQVLAAEEGKKRETLSTEKVKAEGNLVKTEKKLKEVEKLLVDATTAKKKALAEREEMETKLNALYDRTGFDPKAVEAASLDAQARKVLDAWTKSWRVVDLDRRGDNAYISLGSNDGLTPQVTFSVHSVGPSGKLNPVPKGTVEVVRIMGPNQAQARITSVKDAKKDPILKGDLLFNPTWDPNRQRHVAIAGIADLGGDASDSSDELRRLLSRQKVTLDAYVDTNPKEKKPILVGKGVTVNTDYLIVGEGLEGVRDDRSKDKVYSAEFTKLVDKLKEDAKNNGVAIISLRRYLDMIGYQPPKIVTSGQNPR